MKRRKLSRRALAALRTMPPQSAGRTPAELDNRVAAELDRCGLITVAGSTGWWLTQGGRDYLAKLAGVRS